MRFLDSRKRAFILIVLIGLGIFLALNLKKRERSRDSKPPPLIAHAGGGINMKTYTNSLEALNANYAKGHRYFELDFSWTADGRLVLIHDWKRTFKKWFNAKGVPKLSQFKSLKMNFSMTQMSLEDLIKWINGHKDAFVVTDVKAPNIPALKRISDKAGKHRDQFIPQIYALSEYAPAQELGFRNIILTLYCLKISDKKILDFATRKHLFAVTMPLNKAIETPLARNLIKKKVRVYVHTVNKLEVWEKLKQIGISGVYTDFITEADLSEFIRSERTIL